ncbi:hypothetical protein N7495_009010 [Penicillium taxi]|uniref:uncharacterized protein n=1 Tax=Penicillium taxi TaxID=168475 RepID=UPI0025459A3B|nr:uncharacterized protein N7495_009010 [Penicillium taxi]KAJ5888969.1 hypothetical protein N7495_009010 [Penicillium taxi]
MAWDGNALIWALICIVPLLLLYRPQSPPRGCRRLGLKGQSNLHDEFDRKYRQGVQSTASINGEPAWRVKALFTYPLKSCGGIELQESDVVATGLKWDRQFVFAQHSADGWTCRTLRNAGFQRLAHIHPEVWIPDPSASDYHPSLPEVKSHGVMIISFPCPPLPGRIGSLISRVAMDVGLLKSTHSFRIPLYPEDESYPLTPVKIWKDKPLAYDYGRLLPPSLHTYLGFDPKTSPLSLLRACPQHSREIFRNAPCKEKIGFQPKTAFADAYPIHMLNLASHHDVASRCTSIPNLSIRRFRANIVIQGPGAFEEDFWTKLLIGNVEVYAACRTVRCKLPNVDPDTGERHLVEPDRTLKAYRRIDDGDRTNACLGMQLVPTIEEFCVRVGDGIEVLEVGEHRYIKMLTPGEKVEGV